MAHQPLEQGSIPAESPDSRGKKPEPAEPVGHNTQVQPAQQKQIARSEEHRGDAARSGARRDVDQQTVNELKD